MTGSTLTYRFEAGDPSLPVILALHGTGGDEHDLVPLVQAILPGAAILSPRGAVLERGQPRFFRRLAEGVFDLEDLEARTLELAEFVRTATARHALDPSRVVAVGFSNGANIAANLLLRGTNVLAGAVLLRPMLPVEPAVPPALGGVRVLVEAGELDAMIPRHSTERLVTVLREAGALVEEAWYPAGHGLTQADVTRAAQFLHEHGSHFGLSSLTGEGRAGK